MPCKIRERVVTTKIWKERYSRQSVYVRVCESVYEMEKRAIRSSGGQVEKQTQSSFDSSTCPQLENKTYDPPRKKNPLNMEIYSIFFRPTLFIW